MCQRLPVHIPGDCQTTLLWLWPRDATDGWWSAMLMSMDSMPAVGWLMVGAEWHRLLSGYEMPTDVWVGTLVDG